MPTKYKNQQNADIYFTDGCGRCSFFKTPQCKVHTWGKELQSLRSIMLACGLQEELKWGVACYTYQQKNIALIGAFKEYCCISFFKGSLLSDSENILCSPGSNSQSTKQVRFTGKETPESIKEILKKYIFEAIEIEKAGLKVSFKKISEHPIPSELQKTFKETPAIQKAFESLTPGRQRGYLLHFSSAKQTSTRLARIQKCIPLILAGKGMLD